MALKYLNNEYKKFCSISWDICWEYFAHKF